MIDYVYDEGQYTIRLEKLSKRLGKLTKKMKKADYIQMESLTIDYVQLQQDYEDCINELQVEDFLMYGPRGKDPE